MDVSLFFEAREELERCLRGETKGAPSRCCFALSSKINKHSFTTTICKHTSLLAASFSGLS